MNAERLIKSDVADIKNASFCYSVNLLRQLLKMQLITRDEYEKTVSVSAEYYGVDFYCV